MHCAIADSKRFHEQVDAALDLSHTQNIGTMLRTHFSSSQFIVVSLKEGVYVALWNLQTHLAQHYRNVQQRKRSFPH
jgi:hypothetical protein